ncbi:MAG TPA: DNA primase [Acetobacteraceae bacterium]|nr:DNA primase [Acetobacteraceae bacterium]
MALPPGFLDELRVRTPLAPLIGRRVRIERAGRQSKACCPFHGEKTPSFFIYDDHYHCFGCGAHGDAITFIMQAEGASFTEAVERLAREAGLEVPRPSPQAAERERRRHDLTAVLDLAARSFQGRLFLPEGRRALDYLLGRGLSEATIRRFGLGWSPGRGALIADLGREGVEPALMAEAGLTRADPESGRVRELFFERVMFPIRDRAGHVISFGGRLLGEGQPKYVNGPETALFAKRRTLYALDLARAARGAEIVVVEGYLDVIALHQAGFAGAVAPLGTALTEDHLAELWRLSPAPILCFDGDAAGRRAALRTVELALPRLAHDRSLRFAVLPEGEDPDTLVRRQGAGAMRAVLDAPRLLAEMLFDLLREATGSRTEEQRATLGARIEATASLIPDRNLKSEYKRAMFNRLKAIGYQPYRSRSTPAPLPVIPRPGISEDSTRAERGRILTAVLLAHPALLRDVSHAFAEIDLPAPCDRLRKALLAWADHVDVLDSPGLVSHLTSSGLVAEAERIGATASLSLPGFAQAGAMPSEAEAGWWHIFGLMNRGRLQEELIAAQRAFADNPNEGTQRRLIALREALDRVTAAEPEEPVA